MLRIFLESYENFIHKCIKITKRDCTLKKKINIPNLTSFLSIPIPNAIVATTTLISDVVHFVSTSDLSEFFIPA